ncbi:protein kinase domain-containing protein [Streptomyces sp. 6N223]|uniref:protein kinase domain-containing protein n=1 Tax=Streptomyces sp. 6N223 TaxID=3457412 RepID=UPI003FD17F6F
MTDDRLSVGGGIGAGAGVPDRLGDYVLERRLGAGGMGVVYLSRTVAGRQLAVKVIRREYTEDPAFRDRFRREVAAARRVSGAFTAPVVDADPEGDPPWLATLYVPGGSLTDRIERDGPMDAREAARVGAQLAEALQDIHRCGLVHRDLKPGNVLLAEDGVRLIDFGISRALAASRRLTESGVVLGSPPFMAPEQLTGSGEVTEAADVFALGAVVAFAATGHSPFEAGGLPGGDPLAVAYRVVHEEPDLSDVPDSLRDLVSLCLAKDPERRPEVAAVLRMAAWADSPQAQEVRGCPTSPPPAWQGAVRRAAAPPDPETRPEVLRRGRRGRFASVAVAVALAVAVAGVGVWLGVSPEEDLEKASGDGDAPAFRPWELDLRDLGVRDAPTEGFGCARPALLCTAGSGMTVLLDPARGGELWAHNGPRDAVGGPGALAADGKVFAHSDKGVVALDAATGEELWEIDAPELMGAMHRVGGALALQNGDSTLRFYELGGPEPAGSWEVPGRYITQTTGDGARLLAESREGDTGADPELMLLDAEGREMWPTALAPPPEALGLLEMVGMDGQAAYFQEMDTDLPVITSVLRLDLAEGTWTRTELPHTADPRSVVAGGVVYATDTGGRVTAVDAARGEVLFSEVVEARHASEPTVVDGVVYLSDADGRLYGVDGRDGSVLWKGDAHPGTPGPGSDAWAPAPLIVDGRAFVTTLGNTLYAADLPPSLG